MTSQTTTSYPTSQPLTSSPLNETASTTNLKKLNNLNSNNNNNINHNHNDHNDPSHIASPTTNNNNASLQPPPPPQSRSLRTNKRSELEKLIREFQNKLGNDWEKYHETLALFLIGKLSRVELVTIITPLLKDGGLIKYHNKLLLLNFANSLKDGQLDFHNEFASFWNKKSAKSSKVKSSQYEKVKSNIMSLPIRERRRIKSITRDGGKKGKITAGITLTRHSLLPKIPMIQDKDEQQLQVNNLVQWQQDVVNGINTPIASENYELPDLDNLSKRILMTMREYGLTGGINPQVLEVLMLGLNSHLKNILESAIDVAKYRKTKYTSNDYIIEINNSLNEAKEGLESKKRKIDELDGPTASSLSSSSVVASSSSTKSSSSKDITLNIENLYDTLEMFPHLIEPNGPKLRLSNVMLENDDMVNANSLDYELPPRSFLDTVPVASSTAAKAAAAAAAAAAASSSVNIANGTSKPDGIKTENSNSVPSTGGDKAKDDSTKENDDVKKEDASDPSIKSNASNTTTSATSPNTNNNVNANSPPVQAVASTLPRFDAHIGTSDELKWVLHDLITSM
ncbi:transcriptional regulator of RNA polII, SAGA, subunit-domain-containing protein [Scheffersomyces coipomensis]|uniref:transcriptional regulator of RNA polII, SAGA, subunit-domain-containing protein n=1 Tax=Scheffersomyces coipomensis TaxID=1788519 RepID=UPI00315D75BE